MPEALAYLAAMQPRSGDQGRASLSGSGPNASAAFFCTIA